MSAASFYTRYLLAPTTLGAGAGVLALLLRLTAAPLGAHAFTVSLGGALAVVGTWIGIWEHLRPADGVAAQRTPRQRRGDVLYTALTGASLLAWTKVLTAVGAARAEGVWGISLAAAPLVLQAIIAFIGSEILVFLLHWASHRAGSALLWRIHAVHHRPEGLSLFSGSRVHPIDLAYQTLTLLPAALFGAAPAAITWCFAYQLLAGALQHADLDIRLGPFNWILPGPEVHRVHHHIDPDEAVSFSLNAPLLDLVFRTAGPLHGPGEVPMGVSGERD
jgi:sterol desaturase/sphingolipid hydroxylase (fatty acid hydroxylase superfamily)